MQLFCPRWNASARARMPAVRADEVLGISQSRSSTTIKQSSTHPHTLCVGLTVYDFVIYMYSAVCTGMSGSDGGNAHTRIPCVLTACQHVKLAERGAPQSPEKSNDAM